MVKKSGRRGVGKTGSPEDGKSGSPEDGKSGSPEESSRELRVKSRKQQSQQKDKI